MLPLLAEDEMGAVAAAEAALLGFSWRFEAGYRGGHARKLGLSGDREGDAALATDLLARMADNQADFTLAFRLCEAAERPEADAGVRDLFVDPTAHDA